MNLSTADLRNFMTEFHETLWSYRYMFLVGPSIPDIIIYPHIKFWWYRTMLNFCGIVVAILKMGTGRKFSMSDRSLFSKWSPQYRTNSTLSDFNDISYVGRLWCPELIPDIEKFLPVTILPFWKWRSVEIFQCRESIRDIIIYQHIKFWWYWTMLNFYRPFFIPYFGRIPQKLNIVRYHQNLICG
jgi:hypothetical protein